MVSGMGGVIVVAAVWMLCTFVICPLIKWICAKRNDAFWNEEVDDNSSIEPELTYRHPPMTIGRTNSSLANLLRSAVGKSTESCEEEQEESHLRCHYDPYDDGVVL